VEAQMPLHTAFVIRSGKNNVMWTTGFYQCKWEAILSGLPEQNKKGSV